MTSENRLMPPKSCNLMSLFRVVPIDITTGAWAVFPPLSWPSGYNNELVPSTVRVGYESGGDPVWYWKDRIKTDLSVKTHWYMNLQKYSDNLFDFTLTFDVSIYKFLDHLIFVLFGQQQDISVLPLDGTLARADVDQSVSPTCSTRSTFSTRRPGSIRPSRSGRSPRRWYSISATGTSRSSTRDRRSSSPRPTPIPPSRPRSTPGRRFLPSRSSGTPCRKSRAISMATTPATFLRGDTQQ